ncbi:MAG: helix-turn-helix domain-containing protein [Chitinispirillaceae bacterium]
MDINYLMEQMRRNGYDQKRFARALGVQETKITKIKQGKYLGSFAEVEKIIEVLHLNSQQAYRLLTGQTEPKTESSTASRESIMAKEIEDKDRLIEKLESEIEFLREQNKLLIQSLAEKSTTGNRNSENNNKEKDTRRHSAGKINLHGRRHTLKKE